MSNLSQSNMVDSVHGLDHRSCVQEMYAVALCHLKIVFMVRNGGHFVRTGWEFLFCTSRRSCDLGTDWTLRDKCLDNFSGFSVALIRLGLPVTVS